MEKKKRSLNTYEILLIVLVVVAIISMFVSGKTYTDAHGKTAKVVAAISADTGIGTIMMAPIKGFLDAGQVIGFVFCIGAFLALVNATGALETGINNLVKKMHGKETLLIPVLMFIFSIGGTTYGMCEESVGFYIILAATMLAAGMDPMVGAATVCLGCGIGCLGSTINPFATGAAIDASNAAFKLQGIDAKVNSGTVYLMGLILWLGCYVISTWFVVRYAKKVIAGKGSILTQSQLAECQEAYGNKSDEVVPLTGRQKAVLWIFGLSFVVMIMGFVPWASIHCNGFYNALGWTKYLTGAQLGDWYFNEGATWFVLMGIIIGIIGVDDKSKFPEIIVSGMADMIGVNLVIALARATTVLLASTGMGSWFVEASVKGLTHSHMNAGVFGFLDYLLHVGLSFLVPSSSGLAGLSCPIVSPIVQKMGWSVETSIMINVAANGFVNLFTPTAGAMMGGLALARVPYATWLKFVKGLLGVLFIFVAIVLVIGMLVF